MTRKVLGLGSDGWYNIGVGVLGTALVATVLALLGIAIETKTTGGDLHEGYWCFAIIVSTVAAILLIGGAIWSSIDRERNRHNLRNW